VVATFAVDPLFDVRPTLLVVPSAEFEAVILVVQVGLLEVLWVGIRPAAELVNVVEGGFDVSSRSMNTSSTPMSLAS